MANGMQVGETQVFSVTMSCDTSAYASGDVIADTQQLDGFFMHRNDRAGVLQSLVVIDEDDQGVALDIHFFSGNASLGTENAAPSITDANTRHSLGWVSVATTDYKDIGGARVATIRNIGLPIKAASGTDDLYVGIVNGSGTPTFTASGLKLRIGALLD